MVKHNEDVDVPVGLRGFLERTQDRIKNGQTGPVTFDLGNKGKWRVTVDDVVCLREPS